jgi:hypothetical protein
MINKQLIEARSELKRLISLKEKAVRHTTEWVEQAQNWLNYLEWKEVSEVKAKKKHNKPSQKARVAGTDYQCAWCPEKILNVDAYISRFRRGQMANGSTTDCTPNATSRLKSGSGNTLLMNLRRTCLNVERARRQYERTKTPGQK